MYFHSLPFLAFLIASFAVYWAVREHKTARLGTLMIASLLFYAAYTPLPLIVFFWCGLIDWLCIRGMGRWSDRPGIRKLLVTVSVVSNLGVLGVFKYADLFYATSAKLLGYVGLSVRYEPLGLLLPIGLSFVVFRAISLSVDVYRRQVEPTHSFFQQMLYLLFFPLVVAGPIVRAKDLLERFDAVPRLDPDDGARGLYRIATGIVKKLVIADVIAAGIVDPVFGDPARYTSAECAIAALGYTLQLYYDFSAYSDIAIGASALFGFPLPENFNKPYLAKNLFEFWNRWHISLSTWLRDYLYIPLGGNRVSRPRVLFNLMAVMVLGGLWHGADWRFAVWGAVHGIGLVVTRLWWWWRGRPKTSSWMAAARGWAVTFTIVVLTRIIFRAADMGAAWDMFGKLAEFTPGVANVSLMVWVAIAAAMALHALPHRVWEWTCTAFVRMPVPVRAVALVALGLAIRQVATAEVRPYIYFQF
ncbi:MAG: MBOAT family O-acyltransferase [Myxococcaceae bacterium]